MEYKGQLEGFPTKIVEKMLEKQVEQGFTKNVTVFENNRKAGVTEKGFCWNDSSEGQIFWENVLDMKNFDLFFEKYQKKKELTFPRVMMVWDNIGGKKVRKLVHAIIPERKSKYKVIGDEGVWEFAEELPEPVVKSETELKAEELITKANELLKLAEQLKVL